MLGNENDLYEAVIAGDFSYFERLVFSSQDMQDLRQAWADSHPPSDEGDEGNEGDINDDWDDICGLPRVAA